MSKSAMWCRGLALSAAGLISSCGAGDGSSTRERGTERLAAEQSIHVTIPAATVALIASQDTSIRRTAPNQNYGRETGLDVNRTLVRFDPAALRAAVGPNDILTSARLELTLTNNTLRRRAPAKTVGAHRLKKDWTELGATWNCAIDNNTSNRQADCSGVTQWSMGPVLPNPFVAPATSQVGIAPTQTGVVGFDVMPDVQGFLSNAFPDHGWMLWSGTAQEFVDFTSRETSTPPRLVLTVQRCSPALCDDGNSCTVDTCNATAQCVYTQASNGTACNDGNACTQVDACRAGACVGESQVICTAHDQCHQAGVCNPATGSCSQPASPDGTACNDGNACTGGDVCMAGACQGGPFVCGTVVINEVESNGGVPGDWVELYNTGSSSVDLSGWIFKDNDDTHAYVIPAGTTIAPGANVVLEEANIGFGLGSGDSARLFAPGGAPLVDSFVWTAHAATTYGRCPNGTGAFATTAIVTKGTSNECSADGGTDGGTGGGGTDASSDGAGIGSVVVNEVESNGGVPGDWVELFNRGAVSVDLSGWIFKDNDDTHVYTIPGGTSIAPGAYVMLEEASLGFGLGAADSARLFGAGGLTIADSFTWTSHAATTYGRCPNGTGAFATTTTVTKGGANDCTGGSDAGGGSDGGAVDGSADAGGLVFTPWPGANAVATVDNAGTFASNLSGLYYEPADSGSPAILWAVQNGPSILYRLEWNGTAWVSSTADGWSAGKTMVYPSGAGGPDSEGVTMAEWNAPALYVATERDNTNNAVSRLGILRFDSSAAGTTLVATHEWNITADLPAVGANLGLEGIAWVPDAYLQASSFFDENRGQTYDPVQYPDHGTGLFFVGVEGSGVIYAYALNHVDGSFRRVATIPSGQVWVMDLSFDRETNKLWSYCDNTCGNRSTLLAVDTTPGATFGRFRIRAAYDRPSTMPDINNEGIAFAPESECTAGQKAFFWADDSSTGGHALRRDSVPCGPLGAP